MKGTRFPSVAMMPLGGKVMILVAWSRADDGTRWEWRMAFPVLGVLAVSRTHETGDDETPSARLHYVVQDPESAFPDVAEAVTDEYISKGDVSLKAIVDCPWPVTRGGLRRLNAAAGKLREHMSIMDSSGSMTPVPAPPPSPEFTLEECS